MGFDPNDADAGLLFVLVAPSDVVGVDPWDDMEGFAFFERGFEFDDAGFFGSAGHVEHAHEAAFAGTEKRTGINRGGEGAVAGLVRPNGETAAVVAVFDGMHFIDADGRPSGCELDEGVAGLDDAAFLFGEGILVVFILDDLGTSGFDG